MTTRPTEPSPRGRIARLPRTLLGLPIRAYQVGISPYTPPACRFYPVCSQYALDALRVHGALKGSLLAAGRICRCNPVSRGGIDPVPAPGMWTNPRLRPAPDGGEDGTSRPLPLTETPTRSRHIA